MKAVTPKQMAELDKKTIAAGTPSDELMSIRPDGAFVGEADPLKARLDFMQGAADCRWAERPQ